MVDVRESLFPETGVSPQESADYETEFLAWLEGLSFDNPAKLSQEIVWADIHWLRSAGLVTLIHSLLHEWLPTVGVDLEPEELARLIRPLNALQMRLCPNSSEQSAMASINRRMAMDFRDRGHCTIGEGHELFTERHEMVIATGLKHEREVVSRDPLKFRPWPQTTGGEG